MRTVIAIAVITAFFMSHADARRRSSCDGIHRCTCGSTQARYFGFSRMHNGYNLWQAREWGRAFPRTNLRAGVVGVYPHHVFRVVQPLENGYAIVSDERGQYERNIRGAIFVDPNGNTAYSSVIR